MLLAIATFALGAALASVLLARGPLTVLALVGTAGLWLGLDEPIEGPILVGVTTNHGIHLADAAMVIVVGLVLSVPLAKTLVGKRR